MKLRSLRALIPYVAFLLAYPSSVIAEEIRVYGVPFQVDAIEQLGDDSVKLTLDNRSRIISPEQVPIVVLAESSKRGLLEKHNSSTLQSMLSAAISANHSQSVSLIFLHFLRNPKVTSPELERTIRLVKQYELEVLQSFWAEHAAKLSVNTQALILLVMVEDGSSTVTALSPGSELEKAVWSMGEERMLNLLEQGESCLVLAKALGRAFGTISERATRVKEACNFGISALEAEKSLDINALQQIVVVANKDEFARSIVEPALVRALHQKASENLNANNPEAALSILGDIPHHKISPTTQEMLANALSGISDILVQNDSAQNVRDFLIYNSERSSVIKASYGKAIGRSIIRASNSRDWDLVENGFSLLEQIHLSNDERDNILTEAAFTALSAGERDRGIKYFREASPSFFLKLQFFVFGGYGYRWLVLLVFGAILYLMTRFLKHRRDEQIKSFEAMIHSAGVSQDENYRSRLSIEESRELYRNLVKLGLDSTASEHDVKTAFRDVVKKIHPDRNHAVSDSITSDRNTVEFVDLTRAYDRALELMQKRNVV